MKQIHFLSMKRVRFQLTKVKPHLKPNNKPNLRTSKTNKNQSAQPPFPILQQTLATKKKSTKPHPRMRGQLGPEIKQSKEQ